MKNIKNYESLTRSPEINSHINEGLNQTSVNDCIELLYEAQSQMDDALQNIQGAYRLLQGTELSSTAERLRSYIIGHLEPMISSDHGWMTREVSIGEIIEELKESGFDDMQGEEE
jgi:hypothetical protein